MKTTLSMILTLGAAPALAHSGAHIHPHDGASWVTVVSALALITIAGRVAYARARK